MNQRLELTIETLLDGRTYRLMVPFNAPFEHIFQAIDDFKSQMLGMQEVAKKQQEEQEKAARDTRKE